jgi:cation:H+ antiporter
MDVSVALSLLLGLALLVAGGEVLVRGAVGLAERLGVSPLLIGLTIVALGTSAPELAVSVQAALSGSPGIAIGNIVGSNIANILLILGLSALVFPVAVASRALLRDGVVMLAVAAGYMALAVWWGLDRIVGAGVLLVAVGYFWATIAAERRATADHGAVFDKAVAFAEVAPGRLQRLAGLAKPAAFFAAGLVLIVFGGRLLVQGAVGLAQGFGVSEEVIGLTIVAVGTSLPELVTSVVAAIRRHADVALGNVIGSNILNILVIGGVTSAITPVAVAPQVLWFDMPVMVAASVLLLVFGRSGWRIGRREGAAMLALYAAYLWALAAR